MNALSHEAYEELVAGFALSALEPEDEQDVARHLQACRGCRTDLEAYRATLARLVEDDDVAPPPTVWVGIRRGIGGDVEASSRPPGADPADPPATGRAAAPVVDLAAARAARPRPRRATAWASVAAAVVLVAGGGLVLQVQRDREQLGAVSDRLAAAVRTVSGGPAVTVPLSTRQGRVTAVAVVHDDRLSLLVDGLDANDPSSSVYVLWGQNGAEPARALATFDVPGAGVHVVEGLPPVPGAGLAVPELFVITEEPGRTAPEVSSQPAVATGRAA